MPSPKYFRIGRVLAHFRTTRTETWTKRVPDVCALTKHIDVQSFSDGPSAEGSGSAPADEFGRRAPKESVAITDTRSPAQFGDSDRRLQYENTITTVIHLHSLSPFSVLSATRATPPTFTTTTTSIMLVTEASGNDGTDNDGTFEHHFLESFIAKNGHDNCAENGHAERRGQVAPTAAEKHRAAFRSYAHHKKALFYFGPFRHFGTTSARHFRLFVFPA
ncbi:hypothetical protein niasHT_029280 [Heterodera trifolii]|uniref:Uncharacterized protein n=1 Tax=Heterodera trifolii TaxID=157864 RepID=A0ABD2KD50_9BILA